MPRTEVLLVDENFDSAQNLQSLIPIEGPLSRLHLNHAKHLAAALHFLEDHTIHLVVLDLTHQGDCGPDNIETLLRTAPLIPVIALVRSGDEATGIAARKAGAQDYLVKSEITHELLSRVFLQAIDCLGYQISFSALEKRILQPAIDALEPKIAIFDSRGDILAVNRAWQAFTGTSCEALATGSIESNYLEVCEHISGRGAEDARSIATGIRSVLAGTSDVFERQYACQAHDQPHWLNCRVTIFSDTPQRLMVAHEDITRLKQAEESARISEEQLQLVIDASPYGVFITDRTGRYILVNQAIADLYGISKSEMIGKHDYEIPRTCMTVLENSFNAFVNTREENVPPQFPIKIDASVILSDGGARWFSIDKRPITLFNGCECTVHTAVDVTELCHAQDKLLNSELRLRTILDAQTSKVVMLDLERRVLWPNRKACQDAGLPRQEIIGRKCHMVWGDHSAHCQSCPVEQAIETGTPHSEKRATLDGRSWRVHGFPIRDETDCIVSAVEVVEDITERVNLEGQLRQAQKMESLGTLAGGIAHDFNNILFGILGYTELALERAKGSPTLTKYMGEVYAAGLRATDLTKQILTFSHRSDMHLSPLMIEPVVREALTLLRSTLPTSIEFDVKIEPNLGLILANPTQIHQIMMNLATNASHAMEPNGGVLGVRLTQIEVKADTGSITRSLESGNYLKLTVSDTGCGMSPEIMASIFDPYFTTKDLGEGTGLGLAVVHGIVNEYGGDIQVQSSPGKGTTFNLLFPVVERDAADTKQPLSELLPRGFERILVVDDEPVILKLCSRILKKQGFQVQTENDSLRALELFKDNPGSFDLLLSDVTMPKMTGEILAKEILTIRPDIPVILCTGYSYAVSEKDVKSLGVQALLAKPVVKRQLIIEVRRALDQYWEAKR